MKEGIVPSLEKNKVWEDMKSMSTVDEVMDSEALLKVKSLFL